MCRIFRSRGLPTAPPKSTSLQKTLHILTPTILLERIWICYWTSQVGIENRVVEISKLRQLQYTWAFLYYHSILFQPLLTQIEIKREKIFELHFLKPFSANFSMAISLTPKFSLVLETREWKKSLKSDRENQHTGSKECLPKPPARVEVLCITC